MQSEKGGKPSDKLPNQESQQPLKPALKKPRDVEKETKKIFAYKEVHIEEDPELFKGLNFFLDIAYEGNSLNHHFAKRIESLCGKVSKRIDKNVTHLVWGGGKLETLSRAMQFDKIIIVSTLWIGDSLEQMKLQEEEKYRPADLDNKLKEI